MKMHLTRRFCQFGFAAFTALAATTAFAQQAVEDVSIVVFGPPSLGSFLPPIIKANEFDTANGLNIEFVERPPSAYTTQFNSGEFKVGGSAALLTVGLAEARGVGVTYLFNLFDYWGTVVTSRSDVQSLKDLEGLDLAAGTGTTNYVMFKWLASQQGVDLSEVSVVNTAPPGLVGYAMADRAAGIQLWQPAYTSLMAQKPDTKTIDLNIAASWKAFAGSDRIPYLGVAAHTSWVEENQDVVENLYKAYAEAADWVLANPDAAAALIAAGKSDEYISDIANLIKENDSLGINVQRANDIRADINKVYEVGVSIDYLPSMPTEATIYAGAAK